MARQSLPSDTMRSARTEPPPPSNESADSLEARADRLLDMSRRLRREALELQHVATSLRLRGVR